MNLSTGDLTDLAGIAIRAAKDAGNMIATTRPTTVDHKAGAPSLASQVVTEIDRAAEDIIVAALTPTFDRYDLGLLTEETPDDGGRRTKDFFWCIDPIDGTLAFIEGTPGYAVSIALVARDGSPRIGVVYDPVEAKLFHAVAGAGLFCDEERLSVDLRAGGETLAIYANRGFLDSAAYADTVESLEAVARTAGFSSMEIRAGGGAVMNACGALLNSPACYVMFPGPTGASLWDVAATACLFQEAGAVVTRFNGDRLNLNHAESANLGTGGVLFATDARLAEHIRSIAAE